MLFCHVASAAKASEAASLHLNTVPTVAAYLKFTHRYNLLNLSAKRLDTGHFRALGYVSNELSISDRVMNETALAADEMNKEKLEEQN